MHDSFLVFSLLFWYKHVAKALPLARRTINLQCTYLYYIYYIEWLSGWPQRITFLLHTVFQIYRYYPFTQSVGIGSVGAFSDKETFVVLCSLHVNVDCNVQRLGLLEALEWVLCYLFISNRCFSSFTSSCFALSNAKMSHREVSSVLGARSSTRSSMSFIRCACS